MKQIDLALKSFYQCVIIPVGQVTVAVLYRKQTGTKWIHLVNDNVNAVSGREWMRNVRIKLEERKSFQTSSLRNENSMLVCKI